MSNQNKVGTVFNNYLTANIIFNLYDIGLFDNLSNNEFMDINEFISFNNLSQHKIYSMIEHLEMAGIITFLDKNNIKLTKLGQEFKRNICFYIWAIGGYGKFLQKMGYYLHREAIVDWANDRKGIDVSKGSYLCNKEFMDKYFWREFEKIDVNYVVDIGCGKGDKLFSIIDRFNNINGLGIEIDKVSVENGKNKISQLNLEDKVEIINCDLFSLKTIFPQVDTLLCSLMLHDILNIMNAEIFTSWIKKHFPDIKYMIIIDTMLPNKENSNSSEIFSSAFNLIHSFMGVKLRTEDYYDELFSSDFFKILSKHPIKGVPNTYIYLIKVI